LENDFQNQGRTIFRKSLNIGRKIVRYIFWSNRANITEFKGNTIMRKLASIRKIKHILPIEGADKIELAVIDGWQVVVKKGEYKPDDTVIYAEIDSFLPVKPEYEFLRKSSYKVMADNSEGFRLKTIRFRGQISQGLVLPLRDIPIDTPIGTDVTDLLCIKKYEAPVPACISGETSGLISGRVCKTDQERIQNLPEYFINHVNQVFEASEKIDGTSMSCYDDDGNVHVAGHNWVYKESDTQTMWKTAKRLEIPDRLKGLGVALQGECFGEGIQGNKYCIKGQRWLVFDIWDLNKGRYLTPVERQSLLTKLNQGASDALKIEHVPVLDSALKIFNICPDIKSILDYAAGPSLLRKETSREGIVFKSDSLINNSVISFKVISNEHDDNE
jgi:RNA ligase (TIGR02306 family)